MSSPCLTSMCSNGHLVKVVAPGFVDSKDLFECQICKSHTFVTITDWQDRDDDNCIIPHRPIEIREVNGKKIKRYDVSNVPANRWFSTVPNIETLRDIDNGEILTFYSKGHVKESLFVEYVEKEYDCKINPDKVYHTWFHNQPCASGGFIVNENVHPGNNRGWYKVTVYHIQYWKNSNYNGDK